MTQSTNCQSCIIVHGWGGHALGSFKAHSWGPYIWIRDSLPAEFPQLRVWTYGYASKLLNADSVVDVDEWSLSFWRSIRRTRRMMLVRCPHFMFASLAE